MKYEPFAEKLIQALESFEGHWEKPFFTKGSHQNAFSKREYRGLNVLLLTATTLEKGYQSKKWATFKQWLESGNPVKKGEKATTVVFWKPVKYSVKVEDEQVEEKETVVGRMYYVFNAEQTENYTPEQQPEIEPEVGTVDEFFENTKIPFRFGDGSRAFYTPALDLVTVPHRTNCTSLTEYVATFAHEMTHATGHESRLNRKLSSGFGTENYAFEELIADIGAGFVAQYLGFDYAFSKNNLAYLKSWLKVFKDDPKKIVSACSMAQKAADYLIKRGEIDNVQE